MLHPPAAGVAGNDNANSLVVAVEYAGRRILLPGDLEGTGFARLLATPPLDCDIILAPHHGSARSDPPGFAAWSRPEYVLISGPRHHHEPSVRNAYTSAGARVLHTAESGAIFVTVGKQEISVNTWREPHRGH